jgi:hypothetical protein
MDIKEFELLHNDMLKRHAKELSDLHGKFAFSNNPYKVGDIIKDNSGSIEITYIQFVKGGGHRFKNPECVYNGYELKKDLTRSKKHILRKIYQSNIIK